ncbi:hypothetical protein BN2476_670008 [Paraburkholderia piptadeniae]|uniref:Uncharacterized protein n=1 Tax=Paraburkholderia piptadeniae TaxID=1701573 RepID=A0A1N7SNM4_9BURK|nr:hypothetical protein BN2476_670008 [Paraburkholderia piptadeniae]
MRFMRCANARMASVGTRESWIAKYDTFFILNKATFRGPRQSGALHRDMGSTPLLAARAATG